MPKSQPFDENSGDNGLFTPAPARKSRAPLGEAPESATLGTTGKGVKAETAGVPNFATVVTRSTRRKRPLEVSRDQNQDRQSRYQDTTVPVKESGTVTPRPAKRRSIRNVRRRSSFKTPGKRASSLFGKVTKLPRCKIESRDFYRHISDEMSEPLRMRQLLYWCICKSSFRPPKNNPHEPVLTEIMKTVLKNVLQAVQDGDVGTSWYIRPADFSSTEFPDDLFDTSDSTRPHPENILNHRAKEKWQKSLAHLQEELESWNQQIQKMKDMREDMSQSAETLDSSLGFDRIDPTVLNSSEREMWDLCRMLVADASTSQLQLQASDLTIQREPPAPPSCPTSLIFPSKTLQQWQSKVQSINPLVDQVASTMHVAQQFHQRVVDCTDEVSIGLQTSMKWNTGANFQERPSPLPLAPEQLEAQALLEAYRSTTDYALSLRQSSHHSINDETPLLSNDLTALDPYTLLKTLGRVESAMLEQP
ncbi:hypothetical protein IWQ62_001871 [Dispira parvispora]|uniref:Kinetochore protein Mis13/DSN1 n=1 Tax=Dispira parvispora TaxID=1520584 RepID=A0A9W8E4G0_9FUNG|nr:hypothetical protein IWQ62_001871 [Dispira parvispora]